MERNVVFWGVEGPVEVERVEVGVEGPRLRSGPLSLL